MMNDFLELLYFTTLGSSDVCRTQKIVIVALIDEE